MSTNTNCQINQFPLFKSNVSSSLHINSVLRETFVVLYSLEIYLGWDQCNLTLYQTACKWAGIKLQPSEKLCVQSQIASPK